MLIKILPKENFVSGPQRSHYNDAGADVRALETTVIPAHGVAKFPLGYGIQLPDGYQAVVQPRSGHAAKGIIAQIPPIDSGYTGEIHAIVLNATDKNVVIEKDERIGQIVITPIILAEFVYDLGAERGVGAFGSTGK